MSAPEEQSTDEQPADGAPVASAMVYTGETQALVSAGDGWLFSVDGEAFTADIPAAVDAGDYTVFFKTAENAEAQALTVTVAKADVLGHDGRGMSQRMKTALPVALAGQSSCVCRAWCTSNQWKSSRFLPG